MAQLGPVRFATAIMVIGCTLACSTEVENRDARAAGAGSTGAGGSAVVPTSPATGSGGSAGAAPDDPCEGLACGAPCCDDPDDPCFAPGNSKACDSRGACVELELATCPPESECCSMDWDCGDEQYVPCVEGVCKQPILDACWSNAECPRGCVCQGAFVCPCGFDCDSEDVPGACACDTGGA